MLLRHPLASINTVYLSGVLTGDVEVSTAKSIAVALETGILAYLLRRRLVQQ